MLRTSTTWSQMFPNGDETQPNKEGLWICDKLFAECRKCGIQPLVTLSHCETPLHLSQRYDGRVSREMIGSYENYVCAVFRRYRKKVNTGSLSTRSTPSPIPPLETFLTIGIGELSVSPSSVLPLRAEIRKSIAKPVHWTSWNADIKQSPSASLKHCVPSDDKRQLLQSNCHLFFGLPANWLAAYIYSFNFRYLAVNGIAKNAEAKPI